jgi:hypothetical protein
MLIIKCPYDMYNTESMEQSSKHKRRLNLLNQSHNKYSQDTVYIKVVKNQSLHKESVCYSFSRTS